MKGTCRERTIATLPHVHYRILVELIFDVHCTVHVVPHRVKENLICQYLITGTF